MLSACNGKPGGDAEAPKEITVVTYGGGAYQAAQKKAFFEPFTEKTGIKVNSVIWNAEYDKLKTMVESGKVTWDAVDITAGQYAQGKKDNLFAELQTKPDEEEFPAGTVNADGVAGIYWGTVLAYSKAAFPKDAPQSWKDFWDTKRFPGARSLYDDPRGTLEFALLADGVPKDKLYPLDVDRAFRKLDQIKSDIVWWSGGVEPLQLLLSKKAVLASVWSGRVYASKEKDKIGTTWRDAALELNYWVVPRGSAHTEAASQFIEFASQSQAIAKQSELVGYGHANKASLKHLPEDIQKQLPTYADNWDQSFVVDAGWWADNEKEVTARWREWKGNK